MKTKPKMTTKTTNQIVENLPHNDANVITYLIESHDYPKTIVQIVRVQWTKTQKQFAIRVPNYFTGKNHMLQIGYDSLKQCKQVIEKLNTDGEWQLWTGHIIKTK